MVGRRRVSHGGRRHRRLHDVPGRLPGLPDAAGPRDQPGQWLGEDLMPRLRPVLRLATPSVWHRNRDLRPRRDPRLRGPPPRYPARRHPPVPHPPGGPGRRDGLDPQASSGALLTMIVIASLAIEAEPSRAGEPRRGTTQPVTCNKPGRAGPRSARAGMIEGMTV